MTPRSVAVALAAALAAAAFVAVGAAPASDIGSGLSRLVPPLAVVVAAAVAALLVIAPWEGLLAWVVVMPFLNVARAQLVFGSIQLILPTLFVPVLAAGVLLASRPVLAAGAAADAAPRDGDSLVTRRWTPVRLVWTAAIAVCILAVASPALHGDGAGFTISLHGLVEPALLAGLVVSMHPTRRQVVALLLAIGASVALASVYSVLRIGKIASTLAQAEALRVNLARFTYYNVGIFGNMLAMALPLLVGSALWRREIRVRFPASLVIAVAVGVSLVAAYLTYSKSAWLAIDISLVLVVLLTVRGLRQRLVVLVAAAIVAALVVPYPAYVLRAIGADPSSYTQIVGGVQGSRFTSWDPDTAGGEVSITERVLATEAAIRMTIDNPLFGVGPGGFAAAYAGPYHVANATRGLGHPHNMLADIAAEYGLPLAMLVVGILLACFGALVRAYRSHDPLDRPLSIMLGASLLGFVLVATTFGLDLYRPYRYMNSDVLVAALLMASVAILQGHVRAPSATPSA